MLREIHALDRDKVSVPAPAPDLIHIRRRIATDQEIHSNPIGHMAQRSRGESRVSHARGDSVNGFAVLILRHFPIVENGALVVGRDREPAGDQIGGRAFLLRGTRNQNKHKANG